MRNESGAKKIEGCFDINALLNESVRKGQKEAMKSFYQIYEDLIEAGFEKDQAFELVKVMLISGLEGARNDE